MLVVPPLVVPSGRFRSFLEGSQGYPALWGTSLISWYPGTRWYHTFISFKQGISWFMQTFWHELRKTLFVCQVPASSKVSSGYNGKQSHLSKRKCFNPFESWCYGAVKQFLYHGPRITSNYPKFLLSRSKQVTIGSHIKVCPGWPLVGKCWPVGGVRGSALQCLLYVGPLVHWSKGRSTMA